MVLNFGGGIFAERDVRETPTTSTSHIGGNVLMGRMAGVQFAFTKYYEIIGMAVAEASPTIVYMILPSSGTLQNLHTNIRTNTINGNTDIYVYVNGSQTALTVQYGAATAGKQSDTTNTVSVTAGDLICMKVITGGGSNVLNDMTWGVELAID